jgi:hypothetical protein
MNCVAGKPRLFVSVSVSHTQFETKCNLREILSSDEDNCIELVLLGYQKLANSLVERPGFKSKLPVDKKHYWQFRAQYSPPIRSKQCKKECVRPWLLPSVSSLLLTKLGLLLCHEDGGIRFPRNIGNDPKDRIPSYRREQYCSDVSVLPHFCCTHDMVAMVRLIRSGALFQAMDAAGCMAVLEGAVGAGAVICRS